MSRLANTAKQLRSVLLSRNFACRNFTFTTKSNQKSEVKDNVVKSESGKPEEKDLVLYRQEPTKFYTILNLFCLSQFTLWAFVCSACYSLRDVPVDEKVLNDKDAPFWKKINVGESKYRLTFSALSLGLGYSILVLGWFYIYRSVQFIVLRKCRTRVSFATYSPFSRTRYVEFPITEVSAVGSRNSVGSSMPIKTKGNRFHYIIDLRKGHFPHPRLFDQTVGTQRKF